RPSWPACSVLGEANADGLMAIRAKLTLAYAVGRSSAVPTAPRTRPSATSVRLMHSRAGRACQSSNEGREFRRRRRAAVALEGDAVADVVIGARAPKGVLVPKGRGHALPTQRPPILTRHPSRQR